MNNDIAINYELGDCIFDYADTLEIIRDLCELLACEDINYCHWKSNAMLERSARGENDLDLLVSLSDLTRFLSILFDLGFKQAENTTKKKLPGILDFYGFDQKSGKIVHVHLHCKLLIGHDATKNYHIPIETPYLRSSHQEELFKVPALEFEYVLFILRMVIKHSTWETIFSGQGKLSPSEILESMNFKDRVCIDRVRELVECYIPELDFDLLTEAIQAIEGKSTLYSRIRTGVKLQRQLRAYSRLPKLIDTWLILWDRPIHILFAHILRKVNEKKRFVNGGILIGIVGGDGAGKTTAIKEIYTWLSKEFEVMTVHMGKPTWSFTTILIRGLLKIGRTLGLYPFLKSNIDYEVDQNECNFPGFPWCVRETCTARDRQLAYTKANKFSYQGGITLCDRYPSSFIKLMDGPQIEVFGSNGQPNWLVKWLANIENRFYKQIDDPDLLIVLRANPEIAVNRKKDESPDSVYARSKEVWNLNWDKSPAHIVGADGSLQEVLSKLKTLIWSYL
jgi:thymidylate kinase